MPRVIPEMRNTIFVAKITAGPVTSSDLPKKQAIKQPHSSAMPRTPMTRPPHTCNGRMMRQGIDKLAEPCKGYIEITFISNRPWPPQTYRSGPWRILYVVLLHRLDIAFAFFPALLGMGEPPVHLSGQLFIVLLLEDAAVVQRKLGCAGVPPFRDDGHGAANWPRYASRLWKSPPNVDSV